MKCLGGSTKFYQGVRWRKVIEVTEFPCGADRSARATHCELNRDSPCAVQLTFSILPLRDSDSGAIKNKTSRAVRGSQTVVVGFLNLERRSGI